MGFVVDIDRCVYACRVSINVEALVELASFDGRLLFVILLVLVMLRARIVLVRLGRSFYRMSNFALHRLNMAILLVMLQMLKIKILS
jgi:hypothetical protein